MELNNRILSTFKDFLNDINMINKDVGEKALKHYSDIIELNELENIKDSEKFTLFLNKLDKHSKKISSRDESVIDHIHLPEIDMKDLWNELSNDNKNNIWKYLQTICLIKLNIESNDELKDILSGNDGVSESSKENLKTLKKMKLLKNGLGETNKDLENKESDKTDTQNEFNNILENTGIGSLAKEIAEDFSMNNENPQDMMNPQSLMSLFTKINQTVQSKIESGDLDLGKVTSELPGVYSNLQNNELFNQFNNMDVNSMDENTEKKK